METLQAAARKLQVRLEQERKLYVHIPRGINEAPRSPCVEESKLISVRALRERERDILSAEEHRDFLKTQQKLEREQHRDAGSALGMSFGYGCCGRKPRHESAPAPQSGLFGYLRRLLPF